MDLFKLFNKRIILTKEKVLFLEIEKKNITLMKKTHAVKNTRI